MPSNPIIHIEGLGKRYRLGEGIDLTVTFREMLMKAPRRLGRGTMAAFQSLGRRLKGARDKASSSLGARPDPASPSPNEFWALRDVSFDVNQGEVVGIIGRNGAGKSTLLKILARVTAPTTGRAILRGRLASLLEVGTGFHAELTGRENIYLNGSILGMTRAEIDRKFDEIVSFAEIEKFLDTPVKRYSSGMYVRLAFAVAAHLEPEIMIVDEVLAVGDSAFQKKCLGKMEDVASSGRTVLFVSHQMNAIRKLCSHCVWLSNGQLALSGETSEVVGAYEASFSALLAQGAASSSHAVAQFHNWEIVEPRAAHPNYLNTIGPFKFRIYVTINRAIKNGIHGIVLRNSESQLMWGWAAYNLDIPAGDYFFEYSLPTLPLRPGVYAWAVNLYCENQLLDHVDCVPELVVSTPPLSHPRDEWAGMFNVPCSFAVNRANNSQAPNHVMEDSQ
ncbi:MAG: ABC transporter ATP-binding protein [Candidatus Sumerlaeota bacterium]|nr:ABC transporter ATP-binding protein [Candidatus Sumerlaeota bacterium]